MKTALLLILLLVSPAVRAQEIYRCSDGQGGFTFTNSPASEGCKAQMRGAEPPPTPRARPKDPPRTALHDAADFGDLQKISRLLAKGMDINARGPNGETPLGLAASGLDCDAALYLLARGANPNVADRYGITPLHMAARLNRAEVVTALLEAGASPDAETTDLKTPLDYAEELHAKEALRLLRERGAHNGPPDPHVVQFPTLGYAPLRPASRVTIRFDVDANGNVTRIETPSSVTDFEYDAVNLMTGIRRRRK